MFTGLGDGGFYQVDVLHWGHCGYDVGPACEGSLGQVHTVGRQSHPRELVVFDHWVEVGN